MMRSMYASVSGLKVHQTMMDIIGNNISNINTVAYKGSRITFKEMLSQTLKGGSAPEKEKGKGGTNPLQIGLGVNLGSVDSDMTSGNLQPTGRQSDVAIQGDGFFIVNDGKQNLYTRAGSLSFDRDGYLFSSTNGYRIQGWKAENGIIGSTTPDTITDILLDKTMKPSATENVSFKGNLNSDVENKLVYDEKINISADNGGAVYADSVTVSLEPSGDFNKWNITMTAADAASDFSVTTADPNSPFSLGNVFKGTIEVDELGRVKSILGKIDTDGDGTVEDVDLLGAGSAFSLDVKGNGQLTGLTLPAVGDSLEISEDNTAPALIEFTNADGSTEKMKTSYELNAKKSLSVDIYDSQGKLHSVKMLVVKKAPNRWQIMEDDVTITNADDASISFSGTSPHIISFNEKGDVVSGDKLLINYEPYQDVAAPPVELDFFNLTQYGGEMTADFDTVDGYARGDFQNFTIDKDGKITGSYDNGQSKILGQIALTRFSNPAGLKREGGLFLVSSNSGVPRIGTAGTNGRGELAPGALEMSNVDLSQQFTEMITAQRGFQAASKLIATSDEMMQQLVNLKR